MPITVPTIHIFIFISQLNHRKHAKKILIWCTCIQILTIFNNSCNNWSVPKPMLIFIFCIFQVSTVESSGQGLTKKKGGIPSRRSSKNKHMENISCQVCGDVAAGFYCGAYICEACKVSVCVTYDCVVIIMDFLGWIFVYKVTQLL